MNEFAPHIFKECGKQKKKHEAFFICLHQKCFHHINLVSAFLFDWNNLTVMLRINKRNVSSIRKFDYQQRCTFVLAMPWQSEQAEQYFSPALFSTQCIHSLPFWWEVSTLFVHYCWSHDDATASFKETILGTTFFRQLITACLVGTGCIKSGMTISSDLQLHVWRRFRTQIWLRSLQKKSLPA